MQPTARRLRIAVVVLLAILVAGMGLAFFVPPALEPGEAAPLLTYLVPALAAMELAVYLALRHRLRARVRRRLRGQPRAPRPELPLELVTLTVLGAAMALGVGLLAELAAWLEEEPLLLVLPALIVAVMLAGLPSAERFEEMIDSLRKESF